MPAYDPGDYLLGTAVADFAPITDAQIVVGLIRDDVARTALERRMARYVSEVIANYLRVSAHPAQADAVTDAMALSSDRLEAGV